MRNSHETLNNIAWEKLFAKYNILRQIDARGLFEITSAQINEYREARLMAKFDHIINLPKIFSDNNLAILPLARGVYVISHFDAYHKFENSTAPITRVSLPTYIQSLNVNDNDIRTETIALNRAFAAGIITDFLQDEDLLSTVSGKMGSGAFSFDITNSKNNMPYRIQVNGSQIEIDAAYEGIRGLSLFEAKRDLSEDFLVRQLYYPFRTWRDRVTKIVRPIFLIYSNGIYRLYEYAFEDINNYNSLVLVSQKNYSVEYTSIDMKDIQDVLCRVDITQEPKIPFPQADRFDRVINICELLNRQELSRDYITEQYAFDERQTNYYTDAARYLGLLDKRKEGALPIYGLSDMGRRLLTLNYKQRQLAYCNLMLSHKAFNDTLRKYFERGTMPETGEIIDIMKASNLYNVNSDSTFERRSSTIKGWLNWIVGLIND